MIYVGIIVFCFSNHVNSCQIMTKPDHFPTLESCMEETVRMTDDMLSKGFYAKGHCARVISGIQT